jgi:phenylpropionate dioxygenase-like ring-hydroxylating dioxygenase large terminal subunit
MSKRYPMGHPYGWYQVAYAGDLKPRDVIPTRYFGKALVLFRTEAGDARLIDAFCPHLGAHLGHGGTIEGETLVCPYHAWRFSSDGVCLEVPYAAQPPEIVGRQCIKSWPVTECNGSIYAWYHPKGRAPSFAVSRMREFDEDRDKWADVVWRRWTVRCHVQDVQENFHDVAHFKAVHKTNPAIDIRFSEHHSHITTASDMSGLSTLCHDGTRVPRRGLIVMEMNGAGLSWSRHAESPAFTVLMNMTPVDDDYVQIDVGVMLEKAFSSKVITNWIVKNVHKGVEQDIPIFENKVYRAAPMFCDGDRSVAEFRTWYKQFYAD